MKFLSIRITCAFAAVHLAFACTPPREPYPVYGMDYRLSQANLVIYGEFKAVPDETIYTGASTENDKFVVDVYCVMKNTEDVDVKPQITIYEGDCGGLCVCNGYGGRLNVGQKVFLMISEATDNDFDFHFNNINIQGAVFDASDEAKDSVHKLCGFHTPENVSPPNEESCDALPDPVSQDVCERPTIEISGATTLSFTNLGLFVTALLAFFT